MTRSALAVLSILSACVPSVAEDLPVAFEPYRVSLRIDFDNAPEFAPEFRDRVSRDVSSAVARTVGERWRLEVQAAGASGPTDLAGLSPAAVPVPRDPAPDGESPGLPSEAGPDKFYFATVRRAGPGYEVSAREWDRLTDSLGPVRRTVAVARESLPRAIVAAVSAAFRPVAIVEGKEDGATLTPKAAAIPTPDPSASEVPAGTLFGIVLRKRDRDGRTTEVRPVPHTYLESKGAARDRINVAVRSALRKPLAGIRGRVEAWAVATPPVESATRLIVTRREDAVPLTGRVVEVRSQPAEPGKEIPPAERTLLTDRSGSVTLPADPKQPLLWLTVKSGDATLMRLPLAPGVDREVVLPLGDDQRRIDAESRIAIITGELIETVAKRATLLAKARAGARTGKYAEADAAIAEATTLPDAASFRRRIAAVETPAAEAADQAGDRLAAARIRALGRKSGALVDRYLNPEPLRTAAEEVAELKRTDPDRAPPPKPESAVPARPAAKPAPNTGPDVPKPQPSKPRPPAAPQF